MAGFAHALRGRATANSGPRGRTSASGSRTLRPTTRRAPKAPVAASRRPTGMSGVQTHQNHRRSGLAARPSERRVRAPRVDAGSMASCRRSRTAPTRTRFPIGPCNGLKGDGRPNHRPNSTRGRRFLKPKLWHLPHEAAGNVTRPGTTRPVRPALWSALARGRWLVAAGNRSGSATPPRPLARARNSSRAVSVHSPDLPWREHSKHLVGDDPTASTLARWRSASVSYRCRGGFHSSSHPQPELP